MNTKLFFSIVTMCVAVITSAQNRTQEQFQQELIQFGKETREMMMPKITPADSTHLLSKEQKFTLKYAKNPKKIFGDDYAINLPIEINSIIGDTTNTKILSFANWSKAYFVENKNFRAILIIPLEAETIIGKLHSEMDVIYDHNGYVHRIVLSNFDIGNDTIQEKILVRSNNIGFLVGATIYNSNNEVIAEVDGKYKNNQVTDYMGNYPERNNNKDKVVYTQYAKTSTSPSNILKSSDWRSANNKGYSRGSDGILRLNNGRSLIK